MSAATPMKQVREQAVKTGRWFGKVLREREKRAVAVEVGGAVFVVARADSDEGKRLRRFARDLGLTVEKPTRAQQTEALKAGS